MHANFQILEENYDFINSPQISWLFIKMIYHLMVRLVICSEPFSYLHTRMRIRFYRYSVSLFDGQVVPWGTFSQTGQDEDEHIITSVGPSISL